MFAFKSRGGINPKRIINAFEFLRSRSEEAALAARREATALKRQQTASEGEESFAERSGEEGSSEQSSRQRSGPQIKRSRPRGSDDDRVLLEEGAGLVSLMGNIEDMEERLTGGWRVVMRADGM